MKPKLLVLVLPAALAFADGPARSSRRVTMADLEDKIRGGWAGQMIGVSFGAPTEFRYNGRIIEGEISWSPEQVSNALQQDDLYVEMTFASVMDRFGLDATTEQYGMAFRDTRYPLWHANACARRLLNNGVKAPLSGHPRYNVHANDIDFQIESDFIGMMTPGLPRESNRFCERVGRVMNWGDGLYGGMFFGGMYAAAYFESDVRRVVEAGLACIPAQSGYGRIIRDVLDWSADHPEDWRETWRLIQEKWDRDDPCPGGALQPFNIDAKLNGSYVALGLLYGRGDFSRTLEISTRAGQDSDCNPSSAAGILGVMLGYSKIPDRWKAGIAGLADRKFLYTDYSFEDISRSTLRRALQVIRRAGGRVDGEEVLVPHQEPRPARLEQWNPGSPASIIQATDAAWTWTGSWTEEKGRADRTPLVGRSAETPGSEATLRFTGTAVLIIGPYSQSGGRADVFLDDRKAGEIQAFIPERTHDTGLWHTYGLKPGPHTLRLVVRGDADPRSGGRKIAVLAAIPFDQR